MIPKKEDKDIAGLADQFFGLDISEENKKQLISRRELIQQKMAAITQVDICFCSSISSAMDSYIKTINAALPDLVSLLNQRENINPRLAFLGYCSKKETFSGMDFWLSVDKMKEALNREKFLEPPSACENVVGALSRASKLSWKSKEKYLILILGAPTFGSSYHDPLLIDEFAEDDKVAFNLEALAQYLSASDIQLIVFKCNPSVDKMLAILAQHYQSQDFKKSIISLDESQKLGFDSQVKLFGNTCFETIASYHESKKIKNCQISPCLPEGENSWNSTTMETKFKFGFYSGEIVSINFDASNPKIDIKIEKIVTKDCCLGIKAISRGAHKDSFQLRLDLCQFIAKISNSSYEHNSLDLIRGDLNAAILSNHIAKKFNEILNPPIQITFFDTHIFEISSEDLKDSPIFKNNRFFLGEVFAEGKNHVFAKNNNQMVNEKIKSSEVFNLLQAFGHFAFTYSLGTLAIEAYQGTVSKDKIFLTEPVIHCEIDTCKFGKTNNSSLGICQFFLSHKCNEFCKKLKLTPVLPTSIEYLISHPEEQKTFAEIANPPPSFEEISKGMPNKDTHAIKHGHGPADIAFCVNNVEASEDEFKNLISKICSFYDANMVKKTGQKRKITAYVYLQDPNIVPALIKQYNLNIKFKDELVNVFVPESRDRTHPDYQPRIIKYRPSGPRYYPNAGKPPTESAHYYYPQRGNTRANPPRQPREHNKYYIDPSSLWRGNGGKNRGGNQRGRQERGRGRGRRRGRGRGNEGNQQLPRGNARMANYNHSNIPLPNQMGVVGEINSVHIEASEEYDVEDENDNEVEEEHVQPEVPNPVFQNFEPTPPQPIPTWGNGQPASYLPQYPPVGYPFPYPPMGGYNPR